MLRHLVKTLTGQLGFKHCRRILQYFEGHKITDRKLKRYNGWDNGCQFSGSGLRPIFHLLFRYCVSLCNKNKYKFMFDQSGLANTFVIFE